MPLIDEYRRGRAVPKMKQFHIAATRMHRVLEQIIRNRMIAENSFPINLLAGVQSFFAEMEPILSAPESEKYTQGSTGATNYEIARYLLARRDWNLDESALRTELRHMRALILDIERPRELYPFECSVALLMCDLFQKMHEIGAAEYRNDTMEVAQHCLLGLG